MLPELPVLSWTSAIPEVHVANAWAWGLNAWWIFALGAAFRHERALRDRVAQAVAAQARAEAAGQRERWERWRFVCDPCRRYCRRCFRCGGGSHHPSGVTPLVRALRDGRGGDNPEQPQRPVRRADRR